MREWHRDLEAIARIEAARRRAEAARNRGRGPMPRPESSSGSWPGSAIADWSWSPSSKVRGKREEYVVAQLRTAVDLVAETRAMKTVFNHHAKKLAVSSTRVSRKRSPLPGGVALSSWCSKR